MTIPDIAVADAKASDANTTRFQPSQVLLAVEIVSPSSKAADRAIKPDLYAEAAIPAYWRLELDPEPRLFGFELRGDRYHQVTDVPAGERHAITAGGLSVELDPGELIRR